MPQTFEESMDLFHRSISRYFPDRTLELDILIAICASFLIKDITQPIALFLLGNPASGKSTLLEIIKELPVILWRDNLTPAALLSAAPNVEPEDQLLHQLNNKVLTIPELAPLINNKNAKELMPDFTRLLDGNSFVRHTGYGRIGSTEQQKFNMVGAIVRITPKMFELFGNMGPRLVFLRLPDREQTLHEAVTRLTRLGVERSYTEKLQVARQLVLAFYENIIRFYPNGVTWDKRHDDKHTIDQIAKLAVLVSKLRAITPKENGKYVGKPLVEDPTRIYMTLLGIVRCFAFINGKTHVSPKELTVARRIALDSGQTDRSDVLVTLLNNNGSITKKKFCKLTHLSDKKTDGLFEEMVRVGICEHVKKCADAIILKNEWLWLMTSKLKK